jgi:hypothetical protein
MSCRNVARELLEFFRFGDLDWRSAPHLAHLETCSACREAVGLDRELVIQLQRALEARVQGHQPSPGVWLEIRRRALEPEPRPGRRRLAWTFGVLPLGAAFTLMGILVAPGFLSAPRLQPSRMPADTGFRAAADNDPLPPHADGWYLAYLTPPPPSPPATQLTAWVDPSGRLSSQPRPASGLTQ